MGFMDQLTKPREGDVTQLDWLPTVSTTAEETHIGTHSVDHTVFAIVVSRNNAWTIYLPNEKGFLNDDNGRRASIASTLNEAKRLAQEAFNEVMSKRMRTQLENA